MITYVDTSMLLKLVVEEEGSSEAELIWAGADHAASVSLIVVEARAALAAARRAGRLTPTQFTAAKRVVVSLVEELALIQVSEALIVDAGDLAEAEGLRGYDALHLAGALQVGADVLTSADGALCAAAERRQLHIANPIDR